MVGFWWNLFVLTVAVVVMLIQGVTTMIEVSHNPNDVHFYLYPFPQQPEKNQEIEYNDTASLLGSAIQPNRKTVFIVHGFRSNVSSEMPQEVKNAYLGTDLNYNYIIVSWGALSTPGPANLTTALYALVVGNVPIVARRVADFIKFLMKNGFLALDKIHMVGHSLGAHVSGLTGLYLQKDLGSSISRITGLDPAGPLFFPPVSCRNLMSKDADFVDVIHTNAGILGDITNDGDADFWPNGGISQPGCFESDKGIPPLGNIGFTGVCSHRFAFKLYTASLTKNFYACRCPYVSNLVRICPEVCRESERVLLGYNCPTSARGEFYVRTTNPP